MIYRRLEVYNRLSFPREVTMQWHRNSCLQCTHSSYFRLVVQMFAVCQTLTKAAGPDATVWQGMDSVLCSVWELLGTICSFQGNNCLPLAREVKGQGQALTFPFLLEQPLLSENICSWMLWLLELAQNNWAPLWWMGMWVSIVSGWLFDVWFTGQTEVGIS